LLANTLDPDGKLPLMAGMVTGIIFLGLTAITFISRADFSFMGRFLWLMGLAAIAAIIAGSVFGFSLGLWFSVLMVMMAAGYILYDTSNILHHYHTSQHVAAALALFASIAYLFTQILRILIAMREQ
jgi:FtsH-binding integral membrane protein